MSDEKTYSIMAITRAFLSPDGNIQLEFATPEGPPPLRLLLTPNTLSQVVSGLTELETAAQNQIGSSTGHLATQASDVQDFHIDASAAGEKVIVNFRNSKGRFQAFALSVEQTQELRVAARKAEERARKLASQSRN